MLFFLASSVDIVRFYHCAVFNIVLSVKSYQSVIKTHSTKMLEEISANPGLNHITENILINLDVQSLWRCRLVCKALHHVIKELEKCIKLKQKDFKTLRRIRRKEFLVHPNWKALFEAICNEDNFYR